MSSSIDSFRARATVRIGDTEVGLFRLDALTRAGFGDVTRLPYSIRVLLENLLRFEDGRTVTRDDVERLARWTPRDASRTEIAFRPARVLLQDFTGVPALVDLAAMREQFVKMGGDPSRINPLEPADLVIDHSVQVDSYGNVRAFGENVRLEFERNRERYQFLKWGQKAFRNMRVVPPGTGIVHQVNIEYLARVVFSKDVDGMTLAHPDTVVGTDSHTTMVNGLGVLGWGVGGIEAEAAMLGQPIAMLVPDVVGFRLSGKLREGVTATDAVLTITEVLRKKGVVERFVEFFGPGLEALTVQDRSTIANMAPEYGATVGFFPVDDETIDYLRATGRTDEHVELVRRVLVEQGLFHTKDSPEPAFTEVVELDLADIVPSIAGPKRPQDRVPLREAKPAFARAYEAFTAKMPKVTKSVRVERETGSFELEQGAVVLSAITSCTNTSNPAVLVAAGLLARKAVDRGLATKPWVKTSFAPGSQVVTEYMKAAGLMEALERLRFHLVGYGCTTCIGNSGPLDDDIMHAIREGDLVVVSVLSGNRNFEGRVSPMTRANYLASPPLCVAYALAGTMHVDFETDPLGIASDGTPVFLRDVWPSTREIATTIRSYVTPDEFRERYSVVLEGPPAWKDVTPPGGETFAWDDASTYIRRAPFFDGVEKGPPPKPGDVLGARVLAMLGDSITTDHISPAGNIAKESAAARYLLAHGVEERDFNQYGARRGNHEVMMRGTFANIRLRNELVPGAEGSFTKHFPSEDVLSIYDAAVRYRGEDTPLILVAGKEYGSGSSRDWAAKGPLLLGVRAVVAESFERIHRSNLIGVGILPCVFVDGQSRTSLGLDGSETFDLLGIEEGLAPRKRLSVRTDTGKTFEVICRLDNQQEVQYFEHGGILRYVLRQMAAST